MLFLSCLPGSVLSLASWTSCAALDPGCPPWCELSGARTSLSRQCFCHALSVHPSHYPVRLHTEAVMLPLAYSGLGRKMTRCVEWVTEQCCCWQHFGLPQQGITCPAAQLNHSCGDGFLPQWMACLHLQSQELCVESKAPKGFRMFELSSSAPRKLLIVSKVIWPQLS